MARSNPKLDAIYAVFDKHNVPLDKDGIWAVQGTPVVKHKDVERLGGALKVAYDTPTIIRAERDEAVIMVVGRIGDRMEWSIGEALISREGQPGGNYRVTGKQASYVYAMAEKRAKDRVILKLAELHGDVYSDSEDDELKAGGNDKPSRAANDDKPQASEESSSNGGAPEGRTERDEEIMALCKKDIDACKSVKELTDVMKHPSMIDDLKSLLKVDAAEIKTYAETKLKDLGWGKKKASGD